MKALTVRLDSDLADRLATISTVEGVPQSELIRSAVEDLVERHRADPGFQALLADNIRRAQQLRQDTL